VGRAIRPELSHPGAVGKASGQYQPVWLLPALSGRELAAALESAGFRRVTTRVERDIHLMGGPGAVVRVPLRNVLDADQLREILRAAQLSVTRLLEILERMP
jgi:hypothetical protein